MLTANRLLVAHGVMLIVYVPLMIFGGMVGLSLIMGLFMVAEYLWRCGRVACGQSWELNAEKQAKQRELDRKVIDKKVEDYCRKEAVEQEMRRLLGKPLPGDVKTPEYGAAANRKFERLHNGSPRRRDHTHYSDERRWLR